jgi:hypothetical protein
MLWSFGISDTSTELGEGFLDISWHGCANGLGFVVSRESETAVLVTSPVDGDLAEAL